MEHTPEVGKYLGKPPLLMGTMDWLRCIEMIRSITSCSSSLHRYNIFSHATTNLFCDFVITLY